MRVFTGPSHMFLTASIILATYAGEYSDYRL